MLWMLVLGCSCGTQTQDDLRPAVAPRPSTLVVPHDPKKLEPYPNCVSYSKAVCEVCGEGTDPCVTVKKVNDLCAHKGNCREASCKSGEARLRSDPKGAQGELCTE